ncbi:MAG: HemK2/MTQ2 family protein methyltransferase [Nanoarchaeota archaeon]
MFIYFYQPAEDSYFLSDYVKNYIEKLNNSEKENIKSLDMGTGSGIQSKNLISLGIKKGNITATDINFDALKQAKKLKIKAIKSDLFEKLNKKEKFDLIIFNPPYLPENKFDKEKDTTGGKKGDETIIRFIKSLKSHLKEKGICFLLTSSLTPNTWKKETKKQKLKIRKVGEKSLFMEKFYVWEITI